MEYESAISELGYTRNDDFLSELDLKRDGEGYIETNKFYESSLKGMYVVGPLNTGEDQAVIAAGQGAIAAININGNLI